MPGREISIAIRRHASLGLAAALATCAAPAIGQTNAVSYPPSRAVGDVATWLQSDTPLGLSQVVDVSPSAVTAVTSAAPMGETHGFLANVSSEALDPEIVGHDGPASWSIPVEVDCERRVVRLGAMTGYRSRDLRSEPRVVREANSAWVSPTPSAPLGAVVRSLCDRDFRRPLIARLKAAKQPPQPLSEPGKAAPTRDAPRPALRSALPPAPAMAIKPSPAIATGAVTVQIGASSSLPDIQALLARFKGKFAGDLAGLATTVATVQLDGKTMYRALISGFGSAAEASAFCKKLAAASQACFVRR